MENMDPGYLAHLDQRKTEFQHRIDMTVTLMAAAKLLRAEGDLDKADELEDKLTDAVVATPAEELGPMFIMAMELVVDAALERLTEEERRDLMKSAVAATEMDGDGPADYH